jgi:hypothetical protein
MNSTSSVVSLHAVLRICLAVLSLESDTTLVTVIASRQVDAEHISLRAEKLQLAANMPLLGNNI